MNQTAPEKRETAKSDLSRGILKRGLQIAVQMVLTAGILFIASGRLDWCMAWVYLGIYAVGVSANAAILMRINPELIAERAEDREFTKRWDRILATLWGLLSLVALLIAGLDMRFGWSPEISPAVQVAGLILVVLGFSFSSWAMVSNAFFAGPVRIQEERGHVVCSSGPYRIVRHPGYAGWILSGMAAPVMLGSLWALIPAALAALFLVVRTTLEDKTLREELAGYEEYARDVHYRLVPGLW
jgi:protein-S-isoprenylcysteine O-methyltransferase Ste14